MKKQLLYCQNASKKQHKNDVAPKEDQFKACKEVPSTWIIWVGRWLITMGSFLPLRIGFFPFHMAFPWLVNAGYPNHLLYNWDDPPSWAWSVWKVGWPTYCLPILWCHICPRTESWIITIARYDPYEARQCQYNESPMHSPGSTGHCSSGLFFCPASQPCSCCSASKRSLTSAKSCGNQLRQYPVP